MVSRPLEKVPDGLPADLIRGLSVCQRDEGIILVLRGLEHDSGGPRPAFVNAAVETLATAVELTCQVVLIRGIAAHILGKSWWAVLGQLFFTQRAQ